MADSRAGEVAEARRTALKIGVILGIGVIASLDEIVIHQLLRWHHFYDHGSAAWRTVSDGFLHAVTLTLLVVGAVLLWAERRRLTDVVGAGPIWAGLLLGMGGFQLFDGVVDHKLLRLHQIRPGTDNLLWYDIVWNAGALVMLGLGWWFWRRQRESLADV